MTATPDAPSRTGTSAPEVPVRAEGVHLIGELPGSGYKQPPSLVRRADGQTVQLTRLLFLVLENFGFRQLTLYWRLRGLWDAWRGKTAWEKFARVGFREGAAPVSA